MKRRWLFLPLLLALLALGITVGAALAQSDGEDGDSPVQSFAARVAAILGLDEAQVQDAFNQASGEARDEGLRKTLDRKVEQGWITQEQADECLEWFQAKPDAFLQGHRFFGFGKHGSFGGHMWGGYGRHGKEFFKQAPDGLAPGTLEPSSS
jgi:hypothetical protein